MQTELYILDELVHLKPSDRIAVTYQAQDIGQVDKIVSSRSIGFNIVLTDNNVTLTEYVHQINSGTNLPYVRTAGKLKQDGVWLIQNGFITFDRFSNDEIELTIYDNNIDFFSQLQGNNLIDLDTSNLAHIWDYSTVQSNLLNTYTSGYIYPITQYGGLDLTNNIDIAYQLPAVFAKYIIEQYIIPLTDYTLLGDVLTDSLFESIIIPFTNSDIKSIWRANDAGTQTANNFLFDATLNAFVVGGYANTGTFTGGLYDNPNGQFAFSEGSTDTRVFFTADDITNNSLNLITIDLYRLEPDNTITVLASQGVAPSSSQVINFDSGVVTVNQNDIIGCRINVSILDSNLVSITNYEIKGGWQSMVNTLPDISVIEFLRSLFVQFGIIPFADPVRKEITFHQFKEISDNKSDAVDWSDRIDFSRNVKLEYKIEPYAQENIFSYLQDESVTNSVTKGSFSIPNINLLESQEIFTLQLAACDEVFTTNDNIEVVVIPRYEDKDGNLQPVLNTIPRISYIEQQAVTLDLTDGITTGAQANLKINRFDQLEFDNILSGANYSDLVALLQKAKKLTAFFKLNSVDIQQLDYFKPIFINATYQKKTINGYFAIQSVNNYRGSDFITEVELIKL